MILTPEELAKDDMLFHPGGGALKVVTGVNLWVHGHLRGVYVKDYGGLDEQAYAISTDDLVNWFKVDFTRITLS